MALGRLFGAYLAGLATTYVLSIAFYTQQILAERAAIGISLPLDQQLEEFRLNLVGLAPAFGIVLAIALLVGFLVAGGMKKVIRPLAPIAYPLAGFVALPTAILLIENLVIGGGVGAIGGARTLTGLALQGLAGAAGGLVFAILAGKRA